MSDKLKKDLEGLPGVGETTAKRLMEYGFNTPEKIATATVNELVEVQGISEATAKKLVLYARKGMEVVFVRASELAEREVRKQLTTGSRGLDDLLRGGWRTGYMNLLFGDYRTGKTQIGLQTSVTVQLPESEGGLDGQVLFIDTENTFSFERINQIAARFNVKNPLNNIILSRALNSDHQVYIIDQADKIIKENNVKLIVVDSVMAHFRAEYVGRGTLADRQQQLNRHLRMIKRLTEAFNTITILTTQGVSDPSMLFADLKPSGGGVLTHQPQNILWLRKGKDNLRVARLTDSSYLELVERPYMITTGGIEDTADYTVIPEVEELNNE